jgi:hypothetical protein
VIWRCHVRLSSNPYFVDCFFFQPEPYLSLPINKRTIFFSLFFQRNVNVIYTKFQYNFSSPWESRKKIAPALAAPHSAEPAVDAMPPSTSRRTDDSARWDCRKGTNVVNHRQVRPTGAPHIHWPWGGIPCIALVLKTEQHRHGVGVDEQRKFYIFFVLYSCLVPLSHCAFVTCFRLGPCMQVYSNSDRPDCQDAHRSPLPTRYDTKGGGWSSQNAHRGGAEAQHSRRRGGGRRTAPRPCATMPERTGRRRPARCACAPSLCGLGCWSADVCLFFFWFVWLLNTGGCWSCGEKRWSWNYILECNNCYVVTHYKKKITAGCLCFSVLIVCCMDMVNYLDYGTKILLMSFSCER